jgi:hypothetical protein
MFGIRSSGSIASALFLFGFLPCHMARYLPWEAGLTRPASQVPDENATQSHSFAPAVELSSVNKNNVSDDRDPAQFQRLDSLRS